jgi:hypothetical protein
MAGREDHPDAEIGTESRYPRGWIGNSGFTGWRITVGFVMLLAVPVAVWLLLTLLWPR